MIPKLPNARNNNLIIIQFLDEGEPKTGRVLANNVKQSSPHIGNVNYFESSVPDEILSFIKDEIPNLISNEEEIVLYIDTHGFSSDNGIGHKNAFISWEKLFEYIREVFKNQSSLPIIILSACKGFSFNKLLGDEKNPICSKLIASDGLLPNGTVMGAFADYFYKYGFKFGSEEIDEVNKKIEKINKEQKSPKFSPLIITNYLTKDILDDTCFSS